MQSIPEKLLAKYATNRNVPDDHSPVHVLLTAYSGFDARFLSLLHLLCGEAPFSAKWI